MVGLLDIAPMSRKVQVGDKEVEVFGVSALGIAKLLTKFPEMRKLMTGMSLEIEADRIMELVPDAIASIISAGCGYPGNEAAEQLAATFPAHIQLDLLSPILELTMPKGAKDFFDKLQAAAVLIGASGLEKTADTTSQPPSNVSSDTATDLTSAGS